MGEYKIMNLEDASQYINALYENRGVNKKKYKIHGFKNLGQ